MNNLRSRIRREGTLFGGYAGRLLVVVATCSLLTVGGQTVFAPLLPAIIDDLGITSSQAGFALSTMTALSAVCRYPGGRVADQLSRKTVIVAAIGSMIVGLVILTTTTDYGRFLVGTAAVGIGAGLYLPSAFALLSDLFENRRGEAIGLNNAAVNLGGILAAGLAVAVLARTAWRAAFVPFVVLFLVVAALLHRWNDERYVVSRVTLSPRSTARRLFSQSRIRWMLVSAGLVMFVQRGAIAFVPLFLRTEKSFAPTLAAGTYAGFYLVGMVASPAMGRLGDRIGHASVTVRATFIATVGLLVMLLGRGQIPVVLGVLLFALGMTGFWPGMNAYVLALFPDDSMGGDFGALGTVYLGVGSLGPAYVGLVAERTTYLVAFLSLLLPLIASTVLGRWLSTHS